MFRQRLDFTPDETALKYQREREEYQKRLKDFQSASIVPVAASSKTETAAETVVETEKKRSFLGSDAALIGALILMLLEGDAEQDSVLLGILIYLMW